PKSDNVSISWECRDAVDPFLRRNQLELGLQHDPGRAPGVKNETHVVAGERQNPRGLLDGHNSNRLDHSGIANDAVTDGANARKGRPGDTLGRWRIDWSTDTSSFAAPMQKPLRAQSQ